jgi:hypothetical protein
MNQNVNNFHNWILDEWRKIGRVHMVMRETNTIQIRLWGGII